MCFIQMIGEYPNLARQPSKEVWEATVPRVKELLRVEFHEQGTAAWFAQRETMLTASDIATVLGIYPYESRKGLLRKKTAPPGRRKQTSTVATRWGNTHEDTARKMYEEQTGEFVYEFGVIQHPVHKWLGGSPDGVTATGRLLEIKVSE